MATLVESDDRHEECSGVLELLDWPILVPALCVAEVSHFLVTRLPDPQAELDFLDLIVQGEIEVVDPDDDWGRIHELAGKYKGFPIGATDASVVAAAERLNITDLVTLDSNHFHAITPRHSSGGWTLLP